MEDSIFWSNSFQASFTKFCEGFLKISNKQSLSKIRYWYRYEWGSSEFAILRETDLHIYIDSCLRTTALS